MQKLFFTVIAIGASVGFLMPSGKDARPAAPAPRAASAEADTFSAVSAGGTTVLERSPSGHFYVDAEVNNDLVHFVVDTGATMVALTVDDARRLNIPFSESDFSVVGRSASGDAIGLPVTIDRISVDGKEVRNVRGAVIRDLDVSLLGQTYLTRLASVQMSGDQMRLE
ncbi:MAG: TIGR02281 family clan AA aspartic protease [Alphaproteobacteria bacterium]|nr:TIGR02281 family clan AA aspartic protease [Alphaproteobacteria bacterium]MBV9370186.1 TIGR02281 family clan AA aspartic protease [Alphaproteobacteria bacterium]MBV9902421.1 TIGR02281 family clan AA aspartic protease [Alphaproteobacteria bacterium]